jgi:hypothetical protein
VTVADLAAQAFAHAYDETGGELPVAPRTLRTAETLFRFVESVFDEADHRVLARLVFETGRKEGARSRRENAHAKAYAVHAAAVSTLFDSILGKLDRDDVARQAAERAQVSTTSGDPTLARRTAVAAVVGTAIRAHVGPDDRAALDAYNSTGWEHATAYGRAEAQATPERGGVPVSSIAVGLVAGIAAEIAPGTSTGATQGWADVEIDSLARAIAVKVGSGEELDAAIDAANAALYDAGPAASAYTDLLHAAAVDAFMDEASRSDPAVRFDFVNGGSDPCDECTAASLEGPYDPGFVPDCPQHPNCLCMVEVANSVAV